ncbi:glycosyltransferase family 39 protein [Pseudomonas sp. 6D_7.1_Bac1]|uniref:glycosyltransferase family 39 protein n=1 Tax=Pseudomonas sp. 6D_7.1_Bac1 TaxID=2971615 RepID=UPI0021C72F7D|nr:glycosyltransferase family 39 protein [Pseudomonas sp. 6D_7.1_Bac1]MCU1749564.1 glycosyltransferase family 39 protein [Pseudomonas sp. 6D_7.1_Bac1]
MVREINRSSHYALLDTGWALLIMLVAAWVRFHDLSKPAIWADEGFTLLLSSYDPSQILFHTARDVHPPLYYLLLHEWMNVFGNGVFAARSLSALADVATVVLGIWLVSLLSTRRAAMLAGIMLALLPIAVRYSQEVRMYALLGLLMVGATIAFVYWVKGSGGHWPLAVYVLLMVAGLYTHYFAAVCMASHWAYLLVLGFSREVKHKPLLAPAWWVANGAVILLFVPWVPSLINQSRFSGFNWIVPLDVFTVVSAFWQFVSYSEGPKESVWMFYSLPLLCLAVSAVIVMRDRSEKKFSTLLVMYTWFPLALIALVSLVHPLFVYRYFVFAALGLPMIMAVALDALWGHAKALFFILLVLMVSIESVGLYNVYHRGHIVYAEVNKVDALAEHINALAHPGDGILVANMFLYYPFVYYNKTGVTPMLYTPAHQDGTSGRPEGYQIWTLIQQSADKVYLDNLEWLTPSSGRVWVLDGRGDGAQKVVIPGSWQLLDTFTAGDGDARLFSVCPEIP